MKKTYLLLVLLLATSVSRIANATPQISPVRVSVAAKSGQVVHTSIYVRNTSASAANYSVKLYDFEQADQTSGEPKLLYSGHNSKYGISGWSIGPTSLAVPAGGSVAYNATFSVPAQVAAGTYYGAVVVSDPGAALTNKVASLIFIDVDSPRAKPIVNSLNYSPPSPSSTYGYGVFSLSLKNAGSGILSGQYSIAITTATGKLIDTLTPTSAGSVLPETTRIYNFVPHAGLPKQPLTATLTVSTTTGGTVKKAITLNKQATAVQPTDQQTKPSTSHQNKAPASNNKPAEKSIAATLVNAAKPAVTLGLPTIILLTMAFLGSRLLRKNKQEPLDQVAVGDQPTVNEPAITVSPQPDQQSYTPSQTETLPPQTNNDPDRPK